MKRSIRWIAMGCVVILCCAATSFVTAQYLNHKYRMRYQLSRIPYQDYLKVESIEVEEGLDMLPGDEDTVKVNLTIKGKFYVSDESDPVYIDDVHISERFPVIQGDNRVIIEITPIVKCDKEITGERTVEVPVEYHFEYPLRTFVYGQNAYDFRCDGNNATYGIWQLMRGKYLTDEDWKKLLEN